MHLGRIGDGTSTPITSTATITTAPTSTPSCADLASQITAARSSGFTDAQLLAMIQQRADYSALANCPAVLALQPSSNTMLYVGIVAAALLLLSMGRS